MNLVGDEPANSFSERIQVMQHATGFATTVLEPRNTLYSLVTWLLGYLRYLCGALGYLAACLPSLRVDQHHEEPDTTSYTVKQEPALEIVNNSAVAERRVLVLTKYCFH